MSPAFKVSGKSFCEILALKWPWRIGAKISEFSFMILAGMLPTGDDFLGLIVQFDTGPLQQLLA